MSGLRYESLMDLPPSVRKQVAAQLAKCPKEQQPADPPKENKYHAVKTSVAGIKFDSKKEAERFEVLTKAADLGIIHDLRLQQDFTLLEAYTRPDGQRIRAIRYKADFTYEIDELARNIILGQKKCFLLFTMGDLEFWCRHGGRIVEDTKSRATKTKTYIIKKKLMADRGYEIREV